MGSNKLIVSIDSINPVDYYNKRYLEHTVKLLLRKPAIQRSGDTSLTYMTNRSDSNKRMIVLDTEHNTFTAEMENGFGMTIGEKYTPFMMLQKFIYKGKWNDALSYVVYELMYNNNDYCRVGCKYFRRISKIDRWGIERVNLELWERGALIDDYGKAFIGSVEKFKAFTMKPNNIDYKLKIDNCYNLYKEFSHKPIDLCDYTGDESITWSLNMMKHIFGEHYEMGLVYMKILYEYPEQMMPILVLLSNERQTGKTTFVNWITMIFGGNSVIINPEDIKSSFNAPYAQKNIIMIEESHFDNRQSLEKIKNLATQKSMTVNSKFISQYDIEFFAKIIITSNDVNKFSRVDEEEIRYWVRLIPVLKGKSNHNIEKSLSDEIPAFLRFLLELGQEKKIKYILENGIIDTDQSRAIFTKEDLRTDALLVVKKESRESLHKDIEILLEDHCMQNQEIPEFYFVAATIKNRWFKTHSQFGLSYINRVLKVNMKLKRVEKTDRFMPLQEVSGAGHKIVGRPYIYKNEWYKPKSGKMFDPDTPF